MAAARPRATHRTVPDKDIPSSRRDSADLASVVELVKDYARQETLGPIKGAGKFLEGPIAKCRIKYAAVWPTLQAKFAGAGVMCDQARYLDNGTTVTDNLTGLEWEKKSASCPGIHCVTDNYALSLLNNGIDDGPAYTVFLATLNSAACFDSNCDWRLPTVAETQTILLPEAYPCTTSPCIAAVFGPTDAVNYNTTTTWVDSVGTGFGVVLSSGAVPVYLKNTGYRTRAVRAGTQ